MGKKIDKRKWEKSREKMADDKKKSERSKLKKNN